MCVSSIVWEKEGGGERRTQHHIPPFIIHYTLALSPPPQLLFSHSPLFCLLIETGIFLNYFQLPEMQIFQTRHIPTRHRNIIPPLPSIHQQARGRTKSERRSKGDIVKEKYEYEPYPPAAAVDDGRCRPPPPPTGAVKARTTTWLLPSLPAVMIANTTAEEMTCRISNFVIVFFVI